MAGGSPGYLGSVAYNHNGMMRMYETQSGRENGPVPGAAGGRGAGPGQAAAAAPAPGSDAAGGQTSVPPSAAAAPVTETPPPASAAPPAAGGQTPPGRGRGGRGGRGGRSEEHTSELQSQSNLVCRLLLEKK